MKLSQLRRNAATPLRGIVDQYAGLSKEWNAFPLKAVKEILIKNIERNVLTQKNLFIDAALCLGLGSFGARSKFGFNDKITAHERKTSLLQLLVFETVVECLQSRFKIKGIHFQDPAFDETDVEFLEMRGHIVVPYPGQQKVLGCGERRSLDRQGLGPLLSSSTMLFAPYLDFKPLFEYIYIVGPSIYLGTDFMSAIADNWAGMIIDHYPPVPEEEFEAVVVSYENGVAVRREDGDNCLNLVLTWRADTNDQEVMARLGNRHLAMEEKRKDRWAGRRYVQVCVSEV